MNNLQIKIIGTGTQEEIKDALSSLASTLEGLNPGTFYESTDWSDPKFNVTIKPIPEETEEELVFKKLMSQQNIISTLTYVSYAYNRDLGMTHEGAVRIGLGNDEYKKAYENSKGIAITP